MSAGLVGVLVAEIRDDPEARRLLADALRDELVDVPDHGRLLTPMEVAERIGVTPRTVNRWASEGRLDSVKVGRAWRFSPEALTLAPSHRRPSPAPAVRARRAPSAGSDSSAGVDAMLALAAGRR